MSSTASEEKDDERKTMLIKGTGTPAEEKEEAREEEKAAKVDSEYEKHDKITEATLKPVTNIKSKLDKELQEWEVESTKDGQDSQGA